MDIVPSLESAQVEIEDAHAELEITLNEALDQFCTQVYAVLEKHILTIEDSLRERLRMLLTDPDDVDINPRREIGMLLFRELLAPLLNSEFLDMQEMKRLLRESYNVKQLERDLAKQLTHKPRDLI